MQSEITKDVQAALDRLRKGDAEAESRLWTLVYDELKALARKRVRAGRKNTLTTTVLIHEVYIKLFSGKSLSINDRQHFMALCCRAMRMVMVQHFRRRASQKRQAQAQAVTLADEVLGKGGGSVDILALHQALEQLKTIDPRMVQVVEMRVFGGLANGEIAELLAVTTRTVERLWTKAKLLLTDLLH